MSDVFSHAIMERETAACSNDTISGSEAAVGELGVEGAQQGWQWEAEELLSYGKLFRAGGRIGKVRAEGIMCCIYDKHIASGIKSASAIQIVASGIVALRPIPVLLPTMLTNTLNQYCVAIFTHRLILSSSWSLCGY